MLTLLKNLQFIFRPSFWFMNEPYCPIHDMRINKLMDKHKFTNHNKFGAYLGDTDIWMANYPYAVGIYELHNVSRPSRLTIIRMRKKASEDLSMEDD